MTAALLPVQPPHCNAADYAPADQPLAASEIQPLLEQYCYDCHGNGADEGGLAFDKFSTLADVRAAGPTWDTVETYVRGRLMPPPDAAAFPTANERTQIAAWIDREAFPVDANNPDPGHTVLRRLNRAEYNNTIRDLIGVDLRPADGFPADDSGYGFDNIGAVLSLPPMLMEKYLAAAEDVLDRALATEPPPRRVDRYGASLLEVGFNALGDRGDGWLHLVSLEEDDAAVEVDVPAPGDYIVRVHAFATSDGGATYNPGGGRRPPPAVSTEPMQLALAVDDVHVARFEVTTDAEHPGTYESRVGVPAGRHRIRAVAPRIRGGENELSMKNGRLGLEQPGVVFVRWVEIEGPLPGVVRHFAAADLPAEGEPETTPRGGRRFTANGTIETTVEATTDGEYLLRAVAYADQAGDAPARMEFRVDGATVAVFDVRAPGFMLPIPGQRVFSASLLTPQPQVYEHRLQLAAGTHNFAAAFTNDFVDADQENPNLRDRNLAIEALQLSSLGGAWEHPPMPPPIAELFAKRQPKNDATDDADAARELLREFARRAWRRPISDHELQRLSEIYSQGTARGGSFREGVKLAMTAVLASPKFLYLGEPHPEPSPEQTSATVVRAKPVSELVLASRLSYFLWSSTPDDRLLDLAERGELRTQLDAEVRRMLASPKAGALVENFAGQWLEIRKLDGIAPDVEQFTQFDAWLRDAMRRETELLFETVMREDRSVLEFLAADYTFVNERLARHYGLEGVAGAEFQRVSLAGTRRRGVLTHASVLALTSNPSRTSPVKRGKWVLENLLGTPPPPPPPNVPVLDDPSRQLIGTLRQQMQQHRENPACAACHVQMDAIGFGLEHFDAIGAWRDEDFGSPIDAAGDVGDGATFDGAEELADLLVKTRRKDYLRCLAEKMLTYALGRGVERYDRPAIDAIVRDLEADGDRFSRLVLSVVQSVPFQKRRAGGDVLTADDAQ